MTDKFTKLRVGVVLDGSDPLGGVTSWAEDLARYKPNDIDLIAIVLLPSHHSKSISNSLEIALFSKSILLRLPSIEQEDWHLECHPRNINKFHDLVNQISQEIDAIIPNHYEIGYKFAAALGARGQPPIVIGVCHTEEIYYHHLLSKYRNIISSAIAVCSESVPKLEHIFGQCSFIPYGVALQTPFAQRQPVSDSAPFRIVYVGRLVERQKRISRLAELARRLSESGAYELAIVGDGEEYQNLSRRFQECHLSTPRFRYEFLGALTRREVSTVLPRASAFVLVSEAEGTPISMLEAMAARVVPVVPCIAGIKDVIDDGKNGLLYREGAVDQAASALRYLQSHPIRCLEIAIAARETIVERYSVQQRIGEIFSVIRACQDKATPSSEIALIALRDERMMHWGDRFTVCHDNSELT